MAMPEENLACVTEQMLVEEEKLHKKTLKDEEKIQQRAVSHDPESQELIFERLQNLLSRSQFYSQFLSKKITERQQKDKDTKVSNQPKRRKLIGSQISDLVEDSPILEASSSIGAVPINPSNSERQPRLLTGGQMRDYQLDGFEWLKILFENGINGILADEMGLGKTIQCIALIAHLVDKDVVGPFLICAPLSTLPNWVNEFKRFAPTIPTMFYHGNPNNRKSLIKDLNHCVRHTSKRHIVVITSYEMTMNDSRALSKYEWCYLIIDEGHRIKNFQCKLFSELKKLVSKNRLLLTGTPLQNNLSELWSLLNFLLPEVFNELKVFESWFDISVMTSEDCNAEIIALEREKKVISTLHEILTPFLLRRIKAEVNIELPPKKEILVYAPLMPKQAKLYESSLNRTIKVFFGEENKNENLILKGKRKRKRKFCYAESSDTEDKSSDSENEIIKFQKEIGNSEEENIVPTSPLKEAVLSERNIKAKHILMQLRKICNHPYLIDYPLTPKGEYLIDEQLILQSGKLRILDCMLKELKARGHKVLIFSQLVVMLDILYDYSIYRGYSSCRLHGSMKIEERQEEIDRFNRDPNVFMFLVSTRAGGLGINLTAADTVFIYDSDWNPQCDLQAQDRCHRFGQKKPVVVYRIITANTIDEKIIIRAAAKRKLERIIMKEGRFQGKKPSSSPFSVEELKELLTSTSHDFSVSHDDEEVLTQEQLELLLNRESLPGKFDHVDGVFKVVEEKD